MRIMVTGDYEYLHLVVKALIFFIGIIALSNCQSAPTFDSWELAWLDIYNAGDTLVFESANHDGDTSFIEMKEIFYQAHEGTPYGTIWYRNSALRYHPEGDR